MMRYLGKEVALVSDPDAVRKAEKLILPGVGAFDNGMNLLNRLNLSEALREAAVVRGVPLLGICLGMQLLLGSSEEGRLPGLSLVPGRAKRFGVDKQGLRVPHMGWNTIRVVRPSRLIPNSQDQQRFYFVHSYFVECAEQADVVAITNYGHDFVSVLERGNLMGTQFHPEKSHRFGSALFERFLTL